MSGDGNDLLTPVVRRRQRTKSSYESPLQRMSTYIDQSNEIYSPRLSTHSNMGNQAHQNEGPGKEAGYASPPPLIKLLSERSLLRSAGTLKEKLTEDSIPFPRSVSKKDLETSPVAPRRQSMVVKIDVSGGSSRRVSYDMFLADEFDIAPRRLDVELDSSNTNALPMESESSGDSSADEGDNTMEPQEKELVEPKTLQNDVGEDSNSEEEEDEEDGERVEDQQNPVSSSCLQVQFVMDLSEPSSATEQSIHNHQEPNPSVPTLHVQSSALCSSNVIQLQGQVCGESSTDDLVDELEAPISLPNSQPASRKESMNDRRLSGDDEDERKTATLMEANGEKEL